MSIASPEKFLDFLKKSHDEFQPFAEKLKFDKSHPWHRNTVALYGSILELTGSSIVLVERQMISGVPMLLRSILEAYVDLKNLVEDQKYGYSLELSYLKEWSKILSEAEKGDNQYLASITQASDLGEQIAKWDKEKTELMDQGYRELNKYERFKMAGMEDEYRSIYNTLCCDAHNNIKALVNRHMEIGSNDFNVVFYKNYTPEDSAIYVGTNAEILVTATMLMHEFLESECIDAVNTYRSELDGLRGED